MKMNHAYLKPGLLVFFAVAAGLCMTRMAFAEADESKKPVLFSSSMETVTIGDAKVLVPKGTRVYKDGDVIKVEDVGEYAARRFIETDERITVLEQELKEIKEQLSFIKSRLEEANNSSDSERKNAKTQSP